MEAHTAYILHRRPFRETSLLVELFTADAGRVGVVARGGRKPRKGATPLEPFRPLWATWRGRGELPTLGAVESGGPPAALHGEALYLGLYLNEVLVRLCPRFEPYPGLFRAYGQTLERLTGEAPEVALRRFEAVLLRELGVGPDWSRCAGCGAEVSPGTRYTWAEEQGVLCPACGRAGPGFSGEAVRFLGGGDPPGDPTVRREARDLMRRALAPYLGPRPLESRELLRALRRGGA